MKKTIKTPSKLTLQQAISESLRTKALENVKQLRSLIYPGTPPKLMIESSPGCEECPSCHHETLPKIKEGSFANGRMCQRCKAIVNREGKME